jgi:hypothetical protein
MVERKERKTVGARVGAEMRLDGLEIKRMEFALP